MRGLMLKKMLFSVLSRILEKNTFLDFYLYYLVEIITLVWCIENISHCIHPPSKKKVSVERSWCVGGSYEHFQESRGIRHSIGPGIHFKTKFGYQLFAHHDTTWNFSTPVIINLRKTPKQIKNQKYPPKGVWNAIAFFHCLNAVPISRK